MQFHGKKGRALTLHDAVKEPPTNARNDWIDIRSDTVCAVVEVHRSGYLHNDIKANNILVEEADRYSAVLIDFGKSRKISAPKIYKLTEVEQEYYRENYKRLAPELLVGQPQSSHSDIVSVGMVFKLVASKAECTKGLKKLSKACTFVTPEKRPSLEEIENNLKQMVQFSKA